MPDQNDYAPTVGIACEQPLPAPSGHLPVHLALCRLARQNALEQVAADIEARVESGIRTYGTALRPHNGREAWLDAYQEIIDASLYAMQAQAEAFEEAADVVAPCLHLAEMIRQRLQWRRGRRDASR